MGCCASAPQRPLLKPRCAVCDIGGPLHLTQCVCGQWTHSVCALRHARTCSGPV